MSCFTDIYSKYTWDVWLKHKKGRKNEKSFKTVLKWNRKLKKVCVDEGKEFISVQLRKCRKTKILKSTLLKMKVNVLLKRDWLDIWQRVLQKYITNIGKTYMRVNQLTLLITHCKTSKQKRNYNYAQYLCWKKYKQN